MSFADRPPFYFREEELEVARPEEAQVHPRASLSLKPESLTLSLTRALAPNLTLTLALSLTLTLALALTLSRWSSAPPCPLRRARRGAACTGTSCAWTAAPRTRATSTDPAA